LNESGDNDDIKFIGNGVAGSTALSNMWLPVTEVIGATLSN
jgi:NifU-like protein involved in Fe-S cluster formation